MKILFIGDSITDTNRSDTIRGMDQNKPPVGMKMPPDFEQMVLRRRSGVMGSGYANLLACQLSAKAPGRYEFLNRGVDGDRIVNLLARVGRDVTMLSPDVVSIFVGTNDAFHTTFMKSGTADTFEQIYRIFLDEIRSALPEVRFVLMEPYSLPGRNTDRDPVNFRANTIACAEKVKKLAADYGAVFVPLQKMLDEAAAAAPATTISIDGVHPNQAGHWLIAQEWLKFVPEEYL
jgi:lysophospholipase L1-like esterase